MTSSDSWGKKHTLERRLPVAWCWERLDSYPVKCIRGLRVRPKTLKMLCEEQTEPRPEWDPKAGDTEAGTDGVGQQMKEPTE